MKEDEDLVFGLGLKLSTSQKGIIRSIKFYLAKIFTANLPRGIEYTVFKDSNGWFPLAGLSGGASGNPEDDIYMVEGTAGQNYLRDLTLTLSKVRIKRKEVFVDITFHKNLVHFIREIIDKDGTTLQNNFLKVGVLSRELNDSQEKVLIEKFSRFGPRTIDFNYQSLVLLIENGQRTNIDASLALYKIGDYHLAWMSPESIAAIEKQKREEKLSEAEVREDREKSMMIRRNMTENSQLYVTAGEQHDIEEDPDLPVSELAQWIRPTRDPTQRWELGPGVGRGDGQGERRGDREVARQGGVRAGAAGGRGNLTGPGFISAVNSTPLSVRENTSVGGRMLKFDTTVKPNGTGAGDEDGDHESLKSGAEEELRVMEASAQRGGDSYREAMMTNLMSAVPLREMVKKLSDLRGNGLLELHNFEVSPQVEKMLMTVFAYWLAGINQLEEMIEKDLVDQLGDVDPGHIGLALRELKDYGAGQRTFVKYLREMQRCLHESWNNEFQPAPRPQHQETQAWTEAMRGLGQSRKEEARKDQAAKGARPKEPVKETEEDTMYHTVGGGNDTLEPNQTGERNTDKIEKAAPILPVLSPATLGKEHKSPAGRGRGKAQ